MTTSGARSSPLGGQAAGSGRTYRRREDGAAERALVPFGTPETQAAALALLGRLDLTTTERTEL